MCANYALSSSCLGKGSHSYSTVRRRALWDPINMVYIPSIVVLEVVAQFQLWPVVLFGRKETILHSCMPTNSSLVHV